MGKTTPTMTIISRDPLNPAEILALGHDPRSGAVVLFSGEARNHHKGRAVLSLEYEAYEPMAEKVIREILNSAREKWELNFAHCAHRVGPVGISESAVVVATSSAHRTEAYAANRYIIDRVKHEAPIWKKEYYADGETVWSKNCEHCEQSRLSSPDL